jgi:hypothetical protein
MNKKAEQERNCKEGLVTHLESDQCLDVILEMWKS